MKGRLLCLLISVRKIERGKDAKFEFHRLKFGFAPAGACIVKLYDFPMVASVLTAECMR